jgi:nucleoside 2-deoxyribosyltransferase
MAELTIVGGIYGEKCARPQWDQVYGSGGRAASALANISQNIDLYGYVSERRHQSLELSFQSLGITPHLFIIKDNISFDYLHPLSRPAQTPFSDNLEKHQLIEVEGQVVLRFGMVEGGARVKAKRAIYDPQTGGEPEPFRRNGSEADSLAIVLNENEALRVWGNTAAEAGEYIRAQWKADVVVIKLGTRGALVIDGADAHHEVLPFQSDQVFKIGSGDVFSAIFSYCWGVENRPPHEAARIASHAVADYVENRTLPLKSLPVTATRAVVEARERGQIYLAGPFFDVAQRWLINESQMILEILEAPVFSPIHDVGPASSNTDVAIRDLKGLDESSVVLAFVDSRDPGTLLEVGYAINAEKQVVVLAERLPQHELTMFAVPNCHITHDFSTALYKAVWLA